MTREYSPVGFRQALEARLRNEAEQTGRDLARIRQLLVFDRFLARVFAELGPQVILKGGVALELRMTRARATRDIDLTARGSPERLLQTLQRIGNVVLPDHLRFEVVADPKHDRIVAEGLPYGGRRFRAQAFLAGKAYGYPFGVDVAIAEPPPARPDTIEGSRQLEFVGVAPTTYFVYPIEAHLAEKLHAYTLPRDRPNSRVKDLPDIALLATLGELDIGSLRTAIETLFGNRGTHPVPTSLPDPPTAWEPVYARMARNDALTWADLAAVAAAAMQFVDPVLAGGAGRWRPAAWRWEP